MSIRAEWQRLVEEGHIHRLSQMLGDHNKRTILLSQELFDIFSMEVEEGEQANRRSRLLARLQRIVAGGTVVVCMEPFGARKAEMGRLDPVEDAVWDIRCQDQPGLRVFSQFLEKDVLFAVTCRPRSVGVPWLSWLPLGPRDSKEWERGIAATKREWARLFPTFQPLGGDDVRDYLSNATPE
jgi:hypothetical protein